MNCGTTLWAVLALSCALFLAHTEASLNPGRQSYDQARWFDPAYDLTLSVVVPLAKRQVASSNQTTNETQAYKATDFGCTDDALEWCRQQGGVVSYQQYSYISGPSVMAFGNKKAYCDMGTYTLIEVETLASPFLTLAQLAYINPLADFTWNHTQWGNPASQYCVESNGATVSVMFVDSASTCVGTGWSTLPAETSLGLSNSCEFADGSSIDAWALFHGQPKSNAKRLTPHFRTQFAGQPCM